MSCPFKHFRFVIPVLLLAVLIGLFVIVERRTEENLHALEDVLNDPAPEMAYQLQDAAWDFHAEAEDLDRDKTTPEQMASLKNKLFTLNQRAEALETFFVSTKSAEKEQQEIIVFLRSLPGLIGRGQEQLNDNLAPLGAKAENIRSYANHINHMICEFNNTLRSTHQVVLDGLLAKNNAERQRRNVLSVLIFLNGLMLFGFLLCNARSYQRNVKLVETAEQYSALFAGTLQSTQVGVMIRNMQIPGQPVVYINKAFLTMTGYDLNVMENKKSDSLLGRHTDPAVAAAFRDAVEQGEAGSFDLLIYRKDGSEFWSEWHINPLKDSNGNLTHYVSLLTDITGLRQTQEALLLAKEQAEHASAVKSNFLATMSHEIRTPLNGLLGVLDLLGDTRLQQDQRKLLDLAMTSSQGLNEIINDILDYSKMEAGKANIVMEPFALRELLRDVIDLTQPLARGKKLDLAFEIPESLPDHYISDGGRIRQILLNLLTNAVKFTDQGQVELRVEKLLTQESNDQESALLRFEIIDTGIGISAADQDKLFKEFSQIERSTTCRFGGTGLGLAITRRLVEMLNGEIGVASKPGAGSKFWFMLPLIVDKFEPSTDVHQSVKPEEAYPVVDKSKHRILLVEDNETNRIVASGYLDKAGCPHDLATTGAEAVAKAEANTYSLILMDISMPVMDGFEATRRIRALGGWASHVPIIALTAYVMMGDRERCLAAGMNDHLGKPLHYETLNRKLDCWLSGSLPLENAERRHDSEKGSLADLDSRVLHRLVDDLGEGAMLRITQAFLDSLGPRMDVLVINGHKIDLAVIRETAHTLKSSSANCGLMRFSALMEDIEAAAASGDEPRVTGLLKGVGSAYEVARHELNRERERFQG